MFVVSKSHSQVIVEYNGKRYIFSNDNKPVEIPVEALVSAYKSGHIHAHDLIPVEYQGDDKLKEEVKLLKEENLALKIKLKKAKK
jgi:hypothetical protein